MISETELRWGPTVRAVEGVVRVVCRWAVLLGFVAMAWLHGASTEARDNSQLVIDARVGQQAGQACAATLDSLLGQAEHSTRLVRSGHETMEAFLAGFPAGRVTVAASTTEEDR